MDVSNYQPGSDLRVSYFRFIVISRRRSVPSQVMRDRLESSIFRNRKETTPNFEKLALMLSDFREHYFEIKLGA